MKIECRHELDIGTLVLLNTGTDSRKHEIGRFKCTSCGREDIYKTISKPGGMR